MCWRMRVVFGTLRGHLPEQLGGSQQDMHALLADACSRGHQCEAVATLQPGPRLAVYRLGRRLTGRRWNGWPDRRNGYLTWRAWRPIVAEVFGARLKAMPADVAVVDFKEDNAVLEAALRIGVPTLLRIVSVGSVDRGVRIPRDPLVRVFCNSAFVARRVRAQYGIDAPVIYPPIPLERYRAERHDAAFVTFINPTSAKGLDVALGIAERLPHRRFQVVEVLPLTGERLAELTTRLARLPNVTFRRTAPDMRPVYGSTRLLLAPSQVEEAFGRVVVEAQASGVPAVARDVGGLPEAMGAGGVLVPSDAGIDTWAQVVDELLADDGRLERLSAAASANAARPEFAYESTTARFAALLREQAAVGHMARVTIAS